MITVIQNNKGVFDIRPYLTDRGWRINTPSKVTHVSENSGNLVVNNFGIVEGKTYQFSLTVDSISNGSLVVSIGGTSHTPITTVGYHQADIVATNSDPLTLFSDADLVIDGLNIIEVLVTEDVDGKFDTITWSEDRKGWITFKDILPDCGFSMYTNLFTLKQGNLWIHSTEDTIPNNFYGVQYSSKVKFPVSSVGVKTYHSVAIHGNKVLGTTEDGIETQLGQKSDLITYDFTSREGIHYANLLRDSLSNEKLKGRYIVIELTDEETKEQKLQLFKVVVKSNISTVNE